MTAQELANRTMRDNPGVIYRAAHNDGSVAAWSDKLGRWVSVEYELLINGAPAFEQSLYGDKPEGLK